MNFRRTSSAQPAIIYLLVQSITWPATAHAAPPRPVLAEPTAQACLDHPPADMACIPAGWFVRGRDDGPANEKPSGQAWLQTYYMDLLEVTFAQYHSCVRKGKCQPAKPIYSDFNRAKQPMVAMTWFDARDYCKAVGKQLPTEAQWEKAARGADGDLYPWGNEPVDCSRAVIQDGRGRSCGVAKNGLARLADVGRTFEVPSRPAYRYGIHDLVGNAWEWVADWFSADYAKCGEACQGIDPKGLCAGADRCAKSKEKVLRGGSWYWDASYATGTYRRPYVPENKPTSHFGFRCAATWAQAQQLSGTTR